MRAAEVRSLGHCNQIVPSKFNGVVSQGTDFFLELVQDADVNLLRCHGQGDTSRIGFKKEDVREPVLPNK